MEEKPYDLQMELVIMRRKYKKKILKYQEHNSKLKLKLLERITIEPLKHVHEFDDRHFPTELIFDIDEELKITNIDKEKLTVFQNDLKDLKTVLNKHNNLKKCELFANLNHS